MIHFSQGSYRIISFLLCTLDRSHLDPHPLWTVHQTDFSAMNVEAAAALTCLSSYNEIVGKLNRLWDDQMTQIHNVTDVSLMCVHFHNSVQPFLIHIHIQHHWKNPEFPLARIKKIMRMDDEVKVECICVYMREESEVSTVYIQRHSI